MVAFVLVREVEALLEEIPVLVLTLVLTLVFPLVLRFARAFDLSLAWVFCFFVG